MRGKGLLLDEFRFRNGITPAYAGKSLSQAEIPEWE